MGHELTLKLLTFDVVMLSAAGMKHLRDNDVVHRDIKPGNIMRYITEDGRYQLLILFFYFVLLRHCQPAVPTQLPHTAGVSLTVDNHSRHLSQMTFIHDIA